GKPASAKEARIMRRLLPAILAVLGLTHSPSIFSQSLTDQQAAGFVDRFCRTLIPTVAIYDPNTPGDWPPDDPAVFGTLVTAGLAEMIEDALARNAAFEDRTGGKGVLGDGVPWKSVQDAASHCTTDAISQTPMKAKVAVRYKYADAPHSGWSDTLILVRQGQEWLLNDIRYGQDEQNGLRTVLARSLAQ